TSLVNALLVVGAGAVATGLPVAQSLLRLELPAMFAFALVLYPMLRGDAVVSRREAAVLLAAFVALLAWQLVRASAGA
ncbi:MAG TPA: sodium:calcium antiporter, partial [Xanthomonadales bacterium]|nr:sodium:calcium antiporter [Xanthomonadales bacterium]